MPKRAQKSGGKARWPPAKRRAELPSSSEESEEEVVERMKAYEKALRAKSAGRGEGGESSSAHVQSPRALCKSAYNKLLHDLDARISALEKNLEESIDKVQVPATRASQLAQSTSAATQGMDTGPGSWPKLQKAGTPLLDLMGGQLGEVRAQVPSVDSLPQNMEQPALGPMGVTLIGRQPYIACNQMGQGGLPALPIGQPTWGHVPSQVGMMPQAPWSLPGQGGIAGNQQLSFDELALPLGWHFRSQRKNLEGCFCGHLFPFTA